MINVHSNETGEKIAECSFKETPSIGDTIVIGDLEFTVCKKKHEKDQRSFSQIPQYKPTLYVE